MTRAELVQAVIGRGFDYETNAVIQGHVERAYQTICARHDWPFLEAEVTGTAPLEIADLRRVLSVTAGGVVLRPVERRWLLSATPSLSDTGTATYWYLENKTLKAYPVDTAEVAIRYIKVPAVLGENDSPLIPAEWQYLIVDRAIVDCLKADDEYAEARALRGDVEEGIREMAAGLLNRNHQEPLTATRTGQPGDYL